MSARPRPKTTFAPRRPTSAPSRPPRPYISSDDPHTKDFFTKTRVQNHLRQAGLLNTKGEILTQVEYDNKQTDAAIGRENRRKIDDAIKEVLEYMAREHWAYAREYMNNLRNKLLHRFREIENQYPRRNQTITIRFKPDRRNQSNTDKSASDSSDSPSDNLLPPIRTTHPSPQPKSSHAPTEKESVDFGNLRQELSDIKDKLANLDKRLNALDSPYDPNTARKNDPRNTNDDRIATSHNRIRENLEHFKLLQGQIAELEEKKLERQEFAAICAGIEHKFQQDFQTLANRIRNDLETRPNHQTVGQYIQQSEERTNQKLKQLEHFIGNNQRNLRDMQNKIKELEGRLNRLSKTILKENDQSKQGGNPILVTSTAKELQASMPFVELLPVFDMFNKNEWI